METLIVVIWWIGLLGALAVTVVILKQVLLVVGVLRDLLTLARAIGAAAEGLQSRADSAARLQRPAAAALRLENAAGPLSAACATLRQGLVGTSSRPAQAGR